MADTKISGMTAASALTGAEVLPVVQSAANVKATTQQVVDAAMTTGLSRQALGSINTNTTIDWSLGSYVTATIAGALTFTFSNPAPTGKACVAYLQLTNGGSATITWPVSVTWAGATAPTLRTSGVDLLRFYTQDNGTTWFGELASDEVGITGFTAAENTSSPNATVYVDSLTANGSATNVDAAFVPKGTGAILAQVPDGTTTGGDKRGAKAVDWQTGRGAAAQVASGAYSFIGGGYYNTASGLGAHVGGGYNNTSSGQFSMVIAGATNVASGEYATVGGGLNTASGNNSTAFGNQNTASGNHSFAVGLANAASGVASWCPGGYSATTRGLHGGYAWSSNLRSTQGDNQHFGQVTGATTTDAATTTTLTADRGAVSTTNVAVLPNNCAMSGIWLIHARDSSGNAATWIKAFRATRGANAASTAIAFSVDVITANVDAALSTVTVTIAADTTRGGPVVQVTGVAATTIDWLCEPFSLQTVR